MGQFATAKDVSDSLNHSKIYIGMRATDYQSFCRDIISRIGEDLITVNSELSVTFDNGYRVDFRKTGAILLMKPGPETGKLFPTFEQFAAYYLAKFW